jgi:hypothetical protein
VTKKDMRTGSAAGYTSITICTMAIKAMSCLFLMSFMRYFSSHQACPLNRKEFVYWVNHPPSTTSV